MGASHPAGPAGAVRLYFPIARKRNVTTCPRVQVAEGEKLPSPVPPVMFCSTAQATAGAKSAPAGTSAKPALPEGAGLPAIFYRYSTVMARVQPVSAPRDGPDTKPFSAAHSAAL